MDAKSHRPIYMYKPLHSREIRLIISSFVDEEPRWHFRVANLDEPGLEYDALSYTWGDQQHTFSLRIEDSELSIFENLHAALPNIARRNKNPLPIWIDALCINQNNDVEKSIQISMMGDIFKKANTVWVWLGITTHQQKVPEAVSLLGEVAKLRNNPTNLIEQQGRIVANGGNPEQFTELMTGSLRNTAPETWSAMIHLLKNAWFHRVWTVQEGVLANHLEFLCGECNVPQSLLEDALESQAELVRVQLMLGYNQVWTRDSKAILRLRSFVREKGATPWMLMHITSVTSRNNECLEPEDRVYGVLGLVPERDIRRTGVDLRKSIADNEEKDLSKLVKQKNLYTDLAKYLLTQVDPNEKLWWHWLAHSFTLDRNPLLPSWVPDLHNQGHEYIQRPKMINRTFNDQTRASAIRNYVQEGTSPDSLQIQGKMIDEVAVVFPDFPQSPEQTENGQFDGNGSIQLRVSVSEWEEAIAARIVAHDDETTAGHSRDHPASLRISLDTYWRTLVGNETTDHGGEMTLKHYEEFRRVGQRFRGIIAKYQKYNIFSDIVLGTQFAPHPSNVPPDAKSPLKTPKPVIKVPAEERNVAIADCEWLSNLPTEVYDAAFFGKLRELRCSKLFQTRSGRFGFAIKTIQEGDNVCVLNGSPTPHMIRKMADQEAGIYKFVGEAYVHGLMNQEADKMCIEQQQIVFL